MKLVAILITTVLIAATVHASTSEQFFTAYQVAQVSGLSKVIATQAHNPQIIADTITKLQQQKTDTVADKATSDQTKDSYKKEVTNFLNSPQANDYFDKLATDILAKSYSYEQLKALYQLYTSPAMQGYLPNEINFANQQNVQNYIATSKFHQQLDEKTKQILDSVKVEEEKTETPPSPNSQSTTAPKDKETKTLPNAKTDIATEPKTKIPAKAESTSTTVAPSQSPSKASDTAQKEVAIKKE